MISKRSLGAGELCLFDRCIGLLTYMHCLDFPWVVLIIGDFQARFGSRGASTEGEAFADNDDGPHTQDSR